MTLQGLHDGKIVFKKYPKLYRKTNKDNNKGNPKSSTNKELTMTTSPTPMVGVDEEENWHTPQSDDVEMRDPGSVTGRRTRNDQSPEEERGRGVTRSIKQEMIEESITTQAGKGGRRQNQIINLTHTNEEIESNKEKEEDLEKEDSSEESSDDLHGNENSDSSEGSKETYLKEDVIKKGKKEAQEEEDKR